MIFGIGIDMLEIHRIKKAITKKHFCERIYTEKEREEFQSKERMAASDFAGKEAVVKMFGTGFAKGIAPQEIEILRDELGKPFVTLYGNAKRYAQENKIKNIHISLTNTGELVTAYVIGEL